MLGGLPRWCPLAIRRWPGGEAFAVLEAGQRELNGGQEDQLIDIAFMVKAERDKVCANS